jgi:nicotinate-nucleotide adenylyltransferase
VYKVFNQCCTSELLSQGWIKLKTGIFGGTFDPVHIGHLAVAERVRCDSGLDKVVFIPTNTSPFKVGQVNSSGEHRLNMLRLATQENPHFTVSDIELQRGGTSYTVDTMEHLKSLYPSDEFFFIMGMDSFLELNGWKGVDRLTELCRLVVVTRPGYELGQTQRRSLGLPQTVWKRTRFLEVPGLDIAATEIRDRVRRGQSVRYLLIPEVETYIHENGIYQ